MSSSPPQSDTVVLTSLRDKIANIIQLNWNSEIPILWENMPAPSPLPAKGWVEMRLRHGRSVATGLSTKSALLRGRVQFLLASHLGNGMETSDAMIAQLITLFDGRQDDGLSFGQAAVQPPQKDDGFLITTMTISFSYLRSVSSNGMETII